MQKFVVAAVYFAWYLSMVRYVLRNGIFREGLHKRSEASLMACFVAGASCVPLGLVGAFVHKVCLDALLIDSPLTATIPIWVVWSGIYVAHKTLDSE